MKLAASVIEGTRSALKENSYFNANALRQLDAIALQVVKSSMEVAGFIEALLGFSRRRTARNMQSVEVDTNALSGFGRMARSAEPFLTQAND
ncbi:hypothetical protein [Caballeronia sp. DA-9]|uniref:hypothetical protein n=1 Tax=Caballeronia sp. DA-9 TaxID=3436237 RepID=UPI003F68138E